MKIAIIMSDATGYPNRVASYRRMAEAAGVPFVCVSPADKVQPDSTVISVPRAWLPLIPGNRDEWYRNHLHYIVGIRESKIEADFYWCLEADVLASALTWLRLLDLTSDMTEDGLWTRLYHRSEATDNKWFTNPTTPEWADWYCLGAIFRLSHRAVGWLEETAEESREVFTEICVPSEIARRDGTLNRINRKTHRSLYNCNTMRFTNTLAGKVVPGSWNYQMFMHPMKYDDPAP